MKPDETIMIYYDINSIYLISHNDFRFASDFLQFRLSRNIGVVPEGAAEQYNTLNPFSA